MPQGDSVHLLLVWEEPQCRFPLMCVLCLGRWGEESIPSVPPTPPSGQALAASLKSNGNLSRLHLEGNNIGDGGAEALAAECLPAGVGNERQFGGLMWQEG